jgi:predicted DNA-binding protein YlxM (UPF0122 family)
MRLWEIAQKLGVSEQAVSKMLKRVLEETKAEISDEAEKLRAVQLERIEMMIRGLWTKAITGDEKAIETVNKLLTRQARLLGMDAPSRTELSGPDGGPVEVAQIRENLTSKLARLSGQSKAK